MSKIIKWSLLIFSILAGIVLYLDPVSYRYMRVISIVCILIFIISLITIIPKKARVKTAGSLIAIILIIAIWPGGKNISRSGYCKALRSYLDTPYVWGGESKLGIDCSGLLRRAYIRACLIESASKLKPALLKNAADVWWNDCTARKLKEGYSGRIIIKTTTAEAINNLDHDKLLPGDMAITSDGIHCLAYLGNDEWIEADPGNEVIIKHAPDSNFTWFRIPVVIIEWKNISEK